ncbi:MAG: DUF2304 domain-containing protein [bacterium]
MSTDILGPRLHLVAMLAAAGLLSVIAVLVRRAQLSAGIALPWLGAGLVALGIAIYPRALAAAARALGIGLPVNALYFIALLVVAIILLVLTVAVSRGAARTRRLAQEMSLLRARLDHPTPRDDQSAP